MTLFSCYGTFKWQIDILLPSNSCNIGPPPPQKRESLYFFQDICDKVAFISDSETHIRIFHKQNRYNAECIKQTQGCSTVMSCLVSKYPISGQYASRSRLSGNEDHSISQDSSLHERLPVYISKTKTKLTRYKPPTVPATPSNSTMAPNSLKPVIILKRTGLSSSSDLPPLLLLYIPYLLSL